jgi:hypothetical protein
MRMQQASDAYWTMERMSAVHTLACIALHRCVAFSCRRLAVACMLIAVHGITAPSVVLRRAHSVCGRQASTNGSTMRLRIVPAASCGCHSNSICCCEQTCFTEEWSLQCLQWRLLSAMCTVCTDMYSAAPAVRPCHHQWCAQELP